MHARETDASWLQEFDALREHEHDCRWSSLSPIKLMVKMGKYDSGLKKLEQLSMIRVDDRRGPRLGRCGRMRS